MLMGACYRTGAMRESSPGKRKSPGAWPGPKQRWRQRLGVGVFVIVLELLDGDVGHHRAQFLGGLEYGHRAR